MTGCHMDCLSKNTKNPNWIYLLKISVHEKSNLINKKKKKSCYIRTGGLFPLRQTLFGGVAMAGWSAGVVQETSYTNKTA